MSNKLFVSIMVTALIVFAIGYFLIISQSFGKLGVPGFVGYVLCTMSALVALCTTVTFIVLRIEDKKNEK